jgi:hypothetical protein
MAASAWRVGGGRVAGLRSDGQDRLENVLVLGDRLGERPSGRGRVPGGLPDDWWAYPGFKGGPFVELGVQVAELVHDSGLGRAADLAPLALPSPV